MSGFDKKKEFKDAFSAEPGYEEYKTTKPKLYQSPQRRSARKTKKGCKKNGNSQNKRRI